MNDEYQNGEMEVVYMSKRGTRNFFDDDAEFRESILKDIQSVDGIGAKPQRRKHLTKHMRLYPELYRSDVSINPSYTGLRDFPYNVICRRRLKKSKKKITYQVNREIRHFAMMQMFAIDSVRIDRVFSVGMSPKTLIVPDFATEKERRRINELLRDP